MKIEVSIEDEARVVYSKLLKSPYQDWQAVSIHDADTNDLVRKLNEKGVFVELDKKNSNTPVLRGKGLEVTIQDYKFPFPAPVEVEGYSRMFDSGVIATITYNEEVSTTTKLSKDKEHIYDVGEDYREGERIVGEIKRVIKEFYENTRKNKSSPLKELSIAS